MTTVAFLVCLVAPLALALEEYQPTYISPASLNSAPLHQAPPQSRMSLLRYLLAAKDGSQSNELFKTDALAESNEMDDGLRDGLRSSPGAADQGGVRFVSNSKRYSDFAMPYIKYKRNNGIWIWMPAQGYVSVPKDQQALDSADAAKQGKIMRYGK